MTSKLNDTYWFLQQWAIWSKIGKVLPRGFGNSPMFQSLVLDEKSATPLLLISDEKAVLIDGIIAKLKTRDKEMAKAIKVFYLNSENASLVARVLSAVKQKKIDRRTATELVKSGTAWVDACLTMREVA